MKNCLVLFFIYLFLEGVLRKWVIPGVSGTLLYSIKYFLLIMIAFFYLVKRNNGLIKFRRLWIRHMQYMASLLFYRQYV